MTHDHASTRLSPQEFAARMDEAKLRAVALRREAIDSFWRAVLRHLRRIGHGAGAGRKLPTSVPLPLREMATPQPRCGSAAQ
ncbi:hypothetical protein ACVNIS_05675 [Sphaerotilaceae bacterium SBD11-9]